MSLVAALFVIWNAFSMNLAERRRSLATIRALGATRAQVARALLVEAALLGVGGAVVGVLAGIAGSRLLALGIQAMLGAALPAPEIPAGPLLLAFVLGPATTLLATLAPARRAARRDPLGDLLGAPETTSSRASHRTGAVGLVLLVLALGMSLGFRGGVLGPAFIAPGMALGLLGAALAFPLLLPWLRGVVVRLLAPVVGPAGRLGLRQVVARPVHTTLSSTVLFLAVAAGVGMGNEILGGVEDVRDWSRRTLVHDWIVRATMPESGTMVTAPIPEALGDELRRMDAVAYVDEMRFIPALAGDVPVIVLARTFEPGRPLRLDFHQTLGGAPPTALGPGEIIVGTALAGRSASCPGRPHPMPGRGPSA
jgi:putative ABC transport system permease protein